MKLTQTLNNWNHILHQFLKAKDFYIRLILIPLILLVVCFIAGLIGVRRLYQVNMQAIKPVPLTYTLHAYPKLMPYTEPFLFAQSAAIFDPDSGVFLYTKNSTVRFSMASTTKIMTALVAVEHFKLGDILTVGRDYVDGSTLQLYKGEQLSFESLLYAMLLPSANDAAYAIADNYPGGESAFVDAMNAKASSLHLWNTHFSDPAGLEDDNDFTTASELARLAGVVLEQPIIAQVINTKTMTITTADGNASYDLENLNKLLGCDGVVGIKTGTTEGAGQVLITAKESGMHKYIIIVMQSTDRYTDTWVLLHLVDSYSQFIDPMKAE